MMHGASLFLTLALIASSKSACVSNVVPFDHYSHSDLWTSDEECQTAFLDGFVLEENASFQSCGTSSMCFDLNITVYGLYHIESSCTCEGNGIKAVSQEEFTECSYDHLMKIWNRDGYLDLVKTSSDRELRIGPEPLRTKIVFKDDSFVLQPCLTDIDRETIVGFYVIIAVMILFVLCVFGCITLWFCDRERKEVKRRENHGVRDAANDHTVLVSEPKEQRGRRNHGAQMV